MVAIQVRANFKSIAQSHYKPNKNMNDHCLEDRKVWGLTHTVAHTITINNVFLTPGPSLNPQVFNPTS